MSSNVVVFDPSSSRPSFAVKGELSALTKSLVGTAGGGKRISVKGGVFRLFSDGKEVTRIDERYLDVIIVNAAPKVSRTFYAGVYDENIYAAPECWSADGELPDATVHNKQGSSCATCPQNLKGSGQGDSRACRYSQRLAVVLANDVDGDVLQLTIAATSIFGKAEGGDNRPLQEYARFHAAQGDDISMMVTRMRFDTTAAVPKLFFKAMRWLADEEYASTSEKGTSMEAIHAITMTVSQQDAVPAAAPIAGAKPVAKPAAPAAKPLAPAEEPEPPAPKPTQKRPAPVPDDAAEAPAPEPKVKRAAAPAAAPAASSLASVLGEWDDE